MQCVWIMQFSHVWCHGQRWRVGYYFDSCLITGTHTMDHLCCHVLLPLSSSVLKSTLFSWNLFSRCSLVGFFLRDLSLSTLMVLILHCHQSFFLGPFSCQLFPVQCTIVQSAVLRLHVVGAWAYPGTAQIFWVPLIISGSGKAVNFIFCKHIHRIDQSKAYRKFLEK